VKRLLQATRVAGRSGAEDGLDRLIRERTVARIVTIGAGLAAPLPLLLWPVIGRAVALPMLLVAIVIAAWYALVLSLLARGGAPRWLPWLDSTIECSVGTLLVFAVTRSAGPSYGASAGNLLAYPLALLLVASRLRPVLVLYGGVLVFLSHVLVHVLLVEPALAPIVDGPPPLALFIERSFWLILAAAAAAVVSLGLRAELLRGGREGLRRAALERELGRWLSQDVADAILRGDAAPGVAGRREVTVLFCDVRNFTGMCERESPEAVVELLNEFYARAHEAVASHGGSVNKFLGDGFLALFGAPHEHPNHAHAAAAVAHDLVGIADGLRARGGIWGTFDLGVGIDSGEVVVGTVGGLSRAEYTAIGPAVNRAARLQGLAGAGGHRVMLSAGTVARLGHRANVVRLGTQQLKGFAAAEPVYAFRHA
jgi:class 3 adenylate cyclase